ncbi:hypothetical protein GBZ26_05140 [Azospirillum formosense]|uniref:Uncharacterized protein n=1 Tax=Azospirillum formosense TaxID=861533 RepID=A0ABX2KPR2_9PROT|nr:hypothetical protein [Azospirillum formosense]MBY3753890.1 hypothetical protein [Azospirillum formosense]NUB18606.1 hypothetical protein [Azospirillum formosense]
MQTADPSGVYSWYQIAKDFAPAAMALIASIVVTIINFSHNKRMYAVSKSKLKYDMYEKRLKLFQQIFIYYEALLSWSDTEDQKIARENFFRSYHESYFLFPNGSGVPEIMKKINDYGNKVIAAKSMKGDFARNMKDDYLRAFNESQHILTVGFDQAFAELKCAVAPYLCLTD